MGKISLSALANAETVEPPQVKETSKDASKVHPAKESTLLPTVAIDPPKSLSGGDSEAYKKNMEEILKMIENGNFEELVKHFPRVAFSELPADAQSYIMKSRIIDQGAKIDPYSKKWLEQKFKTLASLLEKGEMDKQAVSAISHWAIRDYMQANGVIPSNPQDLKDVFDAMLNKEFLKTVVGQLDQNAGRRNEGASYVSIQRGIIPMLAAGAKKSADTPLGQAQHMAKTILTNRYIAAFRDHKNRITLLNYNLWEYANGIGIRSGESVFDAFYFPKKGRRVTTTEKSGHFHMLK